MIRSTVRAAVTAACLIGIDESREPCCERV